MKQYIKWFIEDFLQEVYVDKDTLGLWMLERRVKNTNESLETKINVPHGHEEQMTIFDLVS